ncbi:hypothetical protein [Winogradskyella aurantiaca]|uniref:hypothetical protein n=1 Tax=Winogradskyella aurantiaca TaxID=2219558 RepID=UPI000E1DC70D|nr:hypothetical protein [Winogradskyella aurantiaca]
MKMFLLVLLCFYNHSYIFDNGIEFHRDFNDQTSAIKSVYYEDWTAGVKGGGGGVLCTVVLDENSSVELDSIFFQGYSAKLIPLKQNSLIYKASISFRNLNNFDLQSNDVKTSESNAELYQKNKDVFDMKLEHENCVVSYLENTVFKYIKFENIPFYEEKLKQRRN